MDSACKIFLQWMFVERLVDLNAAQDFAGTLLDKLNVSIDSSANLESGFDDFMDLCREKLSLFDLKLSRYLFIKDDLKIEYIGLCNVKSDRISQCATSLSAQDIEKFKKIIDLMRKSPKHDVSFSELIEKSDLPKAYAQIFLGNLVSSKWLFYSEITGKYYLGPRSLMELGDFLRGDMKLSTSNDNEESEGNFTECRLCLSLIACGDSFHCPLSGCEAEFHSICIAEYFTATKSKDCPKCKQKPEINL